MTIPDYATYLARVRTGLHIPFVKTAAGSQLVAAGSSMWTFTPDAGTNPTTPAVPDATTTGALGFRSNGNMRVVQVPTVTVVLPTSDTRTGVLSHDALILCDRLSHQGGLVGNSNAVQTTNLPTAALTRYTDGDGVMCGIEVYSSPGAPRVDITIVYVNQAGNPSTTTVASLPSGSPDRALVTVPLAAGDTGVRSVTSLQVVGATTGSPGNLGITLFRPLHILPMYASPRVGRSTRDLYITNLATVAQDACLWGILTQRGVTAYAYTADFVMARD